MTSVEFQTIGAGIADAAGMSGLARRDLDDPEYTRAAIGDALHSMLPDRSLPPGWRFKVYRTPEGLLIDTNPDALAAQAPG